MHVLKLKPPSSGQLAVGAHFPTVISIAPKDIHTQACTCIRLLGPCFKTGQMKQATQAVTMHTHTQSEGNANWQQQQVAYQCITAGNQSMTNEACTPCWHCKLDCSKAGRHEVCIACTRDVQGTSQHVLAHFNLASMLRTIRFTCNSVKYFYLSFQSPFHISLMVLVCYRAQTDIQLWMNSTTIFALFFQEARLLDASHAGKIEHDMQEFHLHCCSPPRGTQEHFHCHGNSTLQFETKVQIVSMSMSLFIRHY